MINAASTITATTPGQPGKGASSVGGAPFTMPFGLSPDGAAPVDRGALLSGASRQVAAAAGPALPVLEADAIDPALAWLPAVNIPAPPPLDIPLGVAAVPAVDATFVAAPQNAASDGSLAIRPAPRRAVRNQPIAAEMPIATVGRSRNAPQAIPPATTVEGMESEYPPMPTAARAGPVPVIGLPRPHVLVGNVAKSGRTMVAAPDPAPADRDVGENGASVDGTIIGPDAAPDRSKPVVTRELAVTREIAGDNSMPVEAAIAATVTSRAGKLPANAPTAHGEADRGALSDRPGRTLERATTPIVLEEAPANGAATPQAGVTQPTATDAEPVPRTTAPAVPGADADPAVGIRKTPIPQADSVRPASSQVAAPPSTPVGDVPLSQQSAVTRPVVDLPDAATPDDIQRPLSRVGATPEPALSDVARIDRSLTTSAATAVSGPAIPLPGGAHTAPMQAVATTPPVIHDVIHEDRNVEANAAAGVSLQATPQADDARPVSSQVAAKPRFTIDDAMPANRAAAIMPAADISEAGTRRAIGARPTSPQSATMPQAAARDPVSAGQHVPIATPDLPERSVDASPAAPSVATGASVLADAPVAEGRTASPRADDRSPTPMPQHSVAAPPAPIAERTAAPADTAKPQANAPRIVATTLRPAAPAPVAQEGIVIGETAPASAVTNLVVDPDAPETPAPPTEGRGRSAGRHPIARVPETDEPAAGVVPARIADSAMTATHDADEDTAEPGDRDVAAPIESPTTLLPVTPLAPAPVAEATATPVASEQVAIPMQRGVDAPVELDRRQPAVAPAHGPAAEPQIATQREADAGAKQDRPRSGTAAMDAPIATGVDAQPEVAQPSARPAAMVANAVAVPLPDTAPSVRTGVGDAQVAQRERPASPVPARTDPQATIAPRLDRQPDALPRGAVERAGPAEQPPVTRAVTSAAVTLPTPDRPPVADLTARTAAPVRENAPRDTAAAAPSPAPAPNGAAPQAAAIARPAATSDSTVVAPAAAVPVVAPTPVALAPQRPAFVREVAGAPRQTVALRPQAAVQPQPAAGTTAPAAQVFGAAMHAATSADERKPVDRTEPALMPVAAPAELRPVAAANDGNPAPVDMRQAGWPATMVDRIERLRDAADANDTRIRLVPDALGGIAISVKSVGDALHVRFVADQDATRALIEDAQPQLAAVAEERGLRIGQTVIETASAAQTQGNASQGNAGGQQPSGQTPSNQQAQTASGNGQQGGQQGGQPGAGQAQAQAGQQQPRQQQPSTARQATAPARAPSHDTDAAGDGRVA